MVAERSAHLWHYRGRRLRQVEWGLWKDIDRKHCYFLCYRPEGRRGRNVRRWVWTGGPHLTLADLRDHVRTVRSKIESRKIGRAPRITAAASLAEYLTELGRRNLSAKYVRDVEAALSKFLKFAPVRSLDGVTLQAVERFLQKLSAAGASPRTQNRYRGDVFAWFAWGVQRGHVSENVVGRVARVKAVKKLKSFPLPDDMIRLVEASESRYDAGLWTFMALTGLRRGSFLSLDAESFGDDGILVRHTKRGEEWYLSFDDGNPLWRPELSVLGARIWSERIPTPSYMRFHFAAACKGAGRTYTLHSLRHGFCSWLAMMGENLQDIQAWAHHASVTTTQEWYAHLRPRGRARAEASRTAVDKMRSQCLNYSLSAG